MNAIHSQTVFRGLKQLDQRCDGVQDTLPGAADCPDFFISACEKHVALTEAPGAIERFSIRLSQGDRRQAFSGIPKKDRYARAASLFRGYHTRRYRGIHAG